MKIIADQNMPLVQQLFAEYGEVQLMPGRQINASHVADADILLVRSVTRVDRALLEQSAVKFVGSATIGTDHIDQVYLAEAGIQFAYAPGCNAEAVVQYDLAVMSQLRPGWQNKRVGIVGCGNVGGRLYQRLCALGTGCAVYDPFLPPRNISDLGPLSEVLACDIICLHTPLTSDGSHPSLHLFDAQTLAQLASDVLLINAGRGAVVDNAALLAILRQGGAMHVALDVWESEPQINRELLHLVTLATPHIAGYSLEGKIKGTQMIYQAFLQWIGVEVQGIAQLGREGQLRLSAASLEEAILKCYDVSADDWRMRQAMQAAPAAKSAVATAFDKLRNHYPVRREFSHYMIETEHIDNADLQSLGFAAVPP